MDGQCLDPYYKSFPKGSTLLHVLAYSSMPLTTQYQIYKSLLEHGADPLSVDENGDTASDIEPCMASYSLTFARGACSTFKTAVEWGLVEVE